MNKPTIIKINNKNYYLATDLQEYDPNFFIGCFRIRQIIDKCSISATNYLFVKYSNEIYTLCNNKYSRAKLLLTKKWADKNIPKLSGDDTQYKYEEAPPILELNDSEKFTPLEI